MILYKYGLAGSDRARGRYVLSNGSHPEEGKREQSCVEITVLEWNHQTTAVEWNPLRPLDHITGCLHAQTSFP